MQLIDIASNTFIVSATDEAFTFAIQPEDDSYTSIVIKNNSDVPCFVRVSETPEDAVYPVASADPETIEGQSGTTVFPQQVEPYSKRPGYRFVSVVMPAGQTGEVHFKLGVGQ